MASTELKTSVNNFVGGLVTDYHELNTPENVTTDEDNCDIDRKGSRRRRKGIQLEPGYSAAAITTTSSTYHKTYVWKSVANKGDLTFLVVQTGSALAFYDQSSDPLSDGILGFSVNLDSHLAVGQTSTADTGIQVDSGKGALFVVGAKIDPFYLTYDEASNTITEHDIEFGIRDLEELDTVEDNDALLATITTERLYDLHNQGWNQGDKLCYDLKTTTGSQYDNVLDFYRATRGVYPPKTKPWWVGKRVGDNATDVFDPSGQYDMIEGGNTLSPIGHFILNPFYKDRGLISGLAINPVIEEERPTAVAFHAGRVFYGFQNKVLYSQIIEDDLGVVGKCYQDADPTAEDISDLIDTDGGVIPISASGNILGLFPVENSLIVFSTNGVWAINGDTLGQGFLATGYSVSKISSLDAVSTRSIIDVEGVPVWMGENGIYALAASQSKDGFSVANILEGKIQNFYDDILPLSKKYASGAYDRVRKTIIWIYSSEDPTTTANLYRCDKVLNYDTILQAYYPYTIATVSATEGVTLPYIVDVFNIKSLLSQRTYDTVIDDVADTVVDSNTDQVVSLGTSTLISPNFETGGVKYLTVVP